MYVILHVSESGVVFCTDEGYNAYMRASMTQFYELVTRRDGHVVARRTGNQEARAREPSRA